MSGTLNPNELYKNLSNAKRALVAHTNSTNTNSTKSKSPINQQKDPRQKTQKIFSKDILAAAFNHAAAQQKQ